MKKVVIAVVSTLAGAAAGAGAVGRKSSIETQRQKGLADKHLALYLMMNQWVKVKQENRSIAAYLENKGYKKIAIYGMNYAGETLYSELADSVVKVQYGIDRKASEKYSEIEVISPEDNLPDVDAVIVTAITFFDEIEENLKRKLSCPILSLEDVLYEV